MIPPALTAMYATSHLGAVHSVVFGGFAPAECAKRIASCQPEVIITATCGIEGGTGKKKVIPYLPLVREAVELSGLKGKGCRLLVWQRPECEEKLRTGERDWKSSVNIVQKKWNLTSEAPNQNGAKQANAKVHGVNSAAPEDEWAPVMDSTPISSNDPLYVIYTSGIISFRIPNMYKQN